jgi:NitT/TauT family transport system ATP-binding protein
MRVSCRDLVVRFESNGKSITALDGVSFETREGEFLSIVGPSGCGKTTLLRTVAQLLQPAAGKIIFEPREENLRSSGLLVLQENSLFPWMTALENAAFGMEMLGVARAVRHQAARKLLERHGLGGRENAYPNQLSVGMKQRVAVLRAFLSDPSMLLMDEPFGALDGLTRSAMQAELLELWQTNRKPVIFVTHDVDEAIYLSDRILILSPQPARVVDEVIVPLPRSDRGRGTPSEESLALKREVLMKLKAASGGALGAL